MVPIAFHMSAYFAMVRSVFFSPEPPIMMGMCAWTGIGSWRSSWKR